MRSGTKRYRLRKENQIVGYAEETVNGMIFNGKYPKFWLKTEQKFTHVDEAIGILDKLNRMIYEYDVLSYKISDKQMRREGLVLWSEEKEAFGIFDIDSKHFSYFFIGDLFLFNKDKVEIISHAFNRPELMKRFDL